MHLAQWGLADQLAGDPAVWLCHQCNDSTDRCPRDAKPGDVMLAVRSVAIEAMAIPRFMGTLVAKAATTWWLLLGLPTLYWIGLLHWYNGFAIPAKPVFQYAEFVPHPLIYATYMGTSALVVLLIGMSALRFWKQIGQTSTRSGSFISAAIEVVIEILKHDRFAKCGKAKPRRWGHFLLFWGFAGAFFVTGVVGLYTHFSDVAMPPPQTHWVKIVANISAASLAVGGLLLLVNRLGGGTLGRTTAFDVFFFSVVLIVIVTGIFTEVLRLAGQPVVGCWVYVLHLGSVLCLFGTFPYSKFAHMLYRSLAMVHQRMAGAKR